MSVNLTDPHQESPAMNFVLTLVASDLPLNSNHLDLIQNPISIKWLAEAKAVDIFLSEQPNAQIFNNLRQTLAQERIDLFINEATNRRKKLLLADMDSTIVQGETLDELADHAGIKSQIAAITARAMNGELDFHTALHDRVKLLENLPLQALEETLTQTYLNTGAQTLVHTMKAHGATCVLVSGGFTFFTKAIAQKTGFDHHHGNILGINDNYLNGKVTPPILDKEAKLTFLKEYTCSLNLQTNDSLTIGDGANDLPMLQAAGMGIGYYAKPAVAKKLAHNISFSDLTTALYAQGYSQKEFS